MNHMLPFKDRRDAGIQLASALIRKNLLSETVVVFGIPRGGMVTADEVAKSLSAPLDALVARKIRAPHQPDLGIGAVALDGDNYFINEELARIVEATPDYLDSEISLQKHAIEESTRIYRGARPPMEVFNKVVLVIDDGIVTGYTFRAALQNLLLRRPARLIAVAPVATEKSIELIRPVTDEIVCIEISDFFSSVGALYSSFDSISDSEVVDILTRNWAEHKGS